MLEQLQIKKAPFKGAFNNIVELREFVNMTRDPARN